MNSNDKIILNELAEDSLGYVAGGTKDDVVPIYKTGQRVSCTDPEYCGGSLFDGIISAFRILGSGVYYDLVDCHGYYGCFGSVDKVRVNSSMDCVPESVLQLYGTE